MSKEYYVYGAYGLHGELLYIGYGKGDIEKHYNHVLSSNKGLNQYYNNNGGGSSTTIEILCTDLAVDYASYLEMFCIHTFRPSCNTRSGTRDCLTLLKEYDKAYVNGDKEMMEDLINENIEFKEMLDVICIDEGTSK